MACGGQRGGNTEMADGCVLGGLNLTQAAFQADLDLGLGQPVLCPLAHPATG